MPWQPYYFSPLNSLIYPQGQVPTNFQIPDGVFTATGPIRPSRFVTIDGSDRVRQSIESDWPIAIAQPNTAVWDSVYAATAGYQLQTFGMGRECWLELGGDVAAGESIRPDDQGRGILSCSTSQVIAAVALQGGSVGQLVRVRFLRRMPVPQNCGYSEFTNEFDFEFGVPCPCDEV